MLNLFGQGSNKMKTKKLDLKEFVEKGFLQEANRLFFHPLGLAMSIEVDDNGNYKLGDIWDYRDDPEGVIFDYKNSDNERIEKAKEKADNVNKLRLSKFRNKHILFGPWQSEVEPIWKNDKNDNNEI